MFSIENQNDNILNGNGLNNTILQTNSLFIPELKNTDTKTTLIVRKTDLSNVYIIIIFF